MRQVFRTVPGKRLCPVEMFSRLNKYKLETFLGQTTPTFACIRSQLSGSYHKTKTKSLFIQIEYILKKW